jgi:hypothetical protein
MTEREVFFGSPHGCPTLTVKLIAMNMELTEMVYILDRSGSMASMREAAVSAFNGFLKEQKELPGEARLSVVLFDDEYLLPYDSLPLEKVRPMVAADFEPRGSTALLDAIGISIDRLGQRLVATPEKDRPGQVVVAIFTDGQENASRKYNLTRIHEMIRHQREVYAWEFLFLAAGQDAMAAAADLGIRFENSATVDYSAKGIDVSAKAISRKAKAFRNRARGGEICEDLDKTMEAVVREEMEKGDEAD